MGLSSDKLNDAEPVTGRTAPDPRVQRAIRLTLAVLGSVGSLFLAWPYWRDFSYWAESQTMWLIYFIAGFVLAIYVLCTFLGNLRTLFEHDAIERADMANLAKADDQEDRS